MGTLPINLFDAAVYICLLVAVIVGFRSGLLRSLATIFGYVCAAPIAVAAAPYLPSMLTDQLYLPRLPPWVVFFGIFLAIGFVLGALLRVVVGEIAGPRVSGVDRLAGALLGAVRIGLLAVLIVLIFDRIIPTDRQPSFLADSKLRPILSLAARAGLRSLPPAVADFIDQLKRERGI